MLLLDANKHDGAICCENDSMILLHPPGLCFAEGVKVDTMRVCCMHVGDG